MRLSLKERICYGCGDLGSQFAYNLVTTYLMVFFTNILGLSTVAAGTIFLIATAFDAINDPLMGSLADHTKTKIGSYRPYMMAASIPYGIFLALCFVAPDWSYTGKMIWAYAVYLLYVVFSTMFQMPYGSLSNVMTNDIKERTILGTFRDWGANLAGFLLNMFAVTIITHFSADGQSMDKRGYLALGIIMGVCCIIFTMIATYGTKERIQPEKNTAKFSESIGSIAKNKPALCILFMVFFINSFVAFRSTFTPYYALYYLGSETMISLILTIMYTLPLLGLLFLPKLIELFGNKNMFIISGICAMISGILSLAAKTNSALIILSAVFGGLTLSGVFANIWGCMPNVADYGEWKTGVRAPGLIYGLATFAIKLAVALSTYLVGWILNWANFDALLDMQSEHTIQFIYKANGILPIIFGIIGIILILPYDLTNEKIEEIKKELSERRQVIDE
jgi:sugar (glycoside-pentoside-hexuronide) transporter